MSSATSIVSQRDILISFDDLDQPEWSCSPHESNTTVEGSIQNAVGQDGICSKSCIPQFFQKESHNNGSYCGFVLRHPKMLSILRAHIRINHSYEAQEKSCRLRNQMVQDFFTEKKKAPAKPPKTDEINQIIHKWKSFASDNDKGSAPIVGPQHQTIGLQFEKANRANLSNAYGRARTDRRFRGRAKEFRHGDPAYTPAIQTGALMIEDMRHRWTTPGFKPPKILHGAFHTTPSGDNDHVSRVNDVEDLIDFSE